MLKYSKELLRQYLSYIKRDNPALITFLFHSIFKDKSEITQNIIDPQQYITVDVYREFTERFLNAGYKFISPSEIDSLDPEGKYILSTFDDGYFNNSLVLPILEEFKTPALFFVTTENIKNNKCFWWDVIYRELAKKGYERKAISKEQHKYKSLLHKEIEKDLINKYGSRCFDPINDIDRPFTISELQKFSKNKYVYIGNHTSNHYILDKYSRGDQYKQILECQESLNEILGIDPTTVAYPNGNYNDDTLSVCREMGFNLGITVDKRKNYFPLKDKLALGRYVLWGNKPIKRQCDIFRSDLNK